MGNVAMWPGNEAMWPGNEAMWPGNVATNYGLGILQCGRSKDTVDISTSQQIRHIHLNPPESLMSSIHTHNPIGQGIAKPVPTDGTKGGHHLSF